MVGLFVCGFVGFFLGGEVLLVCCGFLLAFLVGHERSSSSWYRWCNLVVSEAVQTVCAIR